VVLFLLIDIKTNPNEFSLTETKMKIILETEMKIEICSDN